MPMKMTELHRVALPLHKTSCFVNITNLGRTVSASSFFQNLQNLVAVAITIGFVIAVKQQQPETLRRCGLCRESVNKARVVKEVLTEKLLG